MTAPHLLLDFDKAWQVPGWGPEGSGRPREALPDNAVVHEIIKKRLRRAGYELTRWSFERSTNGWHAKAWLEPAPSTPMEIVALQAVCGSDPLRESCNVQRAREVERFPCFAAARLLAEVRARIAGERDPWVAETVLGPLAEVLEAYANTPDSFWLTRWNTFYTPNPNRRKEHAGPE